MCAGGIMCPAEETDDLSDNKLNPSSNLPKDRCTNNTHGRQTDTTNKGPGTQQVREQMWPWT